MSTGACMQNIAVWARSGSEGGRNRGSITCGRCFIGCPATSKDDENLDIHTDCVACRWYCECASFDVAAETFHMERPSKSHCLPKAVKPPARGRGKVHLHLQREGCRDQRSRWCRIYEIAPYLKALGMWKGQRKVERSGLLALECAGPKDRHC